MMSLSAQPTRRFAGLDAVVADPAAFREWYDEVMPRVYRFLAARSGGDTALAEDLTQQTFVAAVRNRGQYDERADIVSWLCAIGRNALVDHFRRQGRDQRRQDTLVQLHPGTEDRGPARADERDAVERALATLAPDQRLALTFRYFDDLSVRDVADALGRSESATESLLTRAREAFRRAYGDRIDA